MTSLPGIVLIDDKKDELDALQNSFTLSGYPCFPVQYQNDSENETGIDHVSLEMIKPRVIITDLNLQEQQISNSQQLVAPIAGVLKKLELQGPYLLYFWSKNESHVEEVIQLLFERYTDISYPIHYGVLSKSEFMGQPEALKKKVEDIFSEDPIFNALFNWENRVSSAAQATTDSLFNLAKSPASDNFSNFQSETTNKLQTMLAVIGNETLGVKNASDEPEVAIEQGLAPVLHDHMQSNYEHIDRSVWLAAANGIGTKLEANEDIKAHLNSFYHIEELEANSPKNKRGTWIQFEENYLNNSSKILQNLGRPIKVIKNEEFLNCGIGTKITRQEAHDATKLGFIELSAECDQAQRKTKLHRYFLSAMIPIEYEDHTLFSGSRKTNHNGIYRLPNIIVNGHEFIIKISFRYQVGAIPDVNKWLGNPVFKLKDQILADISYQASQHSARPGIIRFD